jgi:ribonuclease E
MATRLLIDAAHPEETRVVVVSGTRLEEFDFESASRKQLKGNIYLAKVTRVEPSLQAAFVDYGGNRHGFLAFGDIHPDYYQIPYEDRQALLEERAAEDAERNAREFGGDDGAPESAGDAPAETAEAAEAGDADSAPPEPMPEVIGGEASAPMPSDDEAADAPMDISHPDPLPLSGDGGGDGRSDGSADVIVDAAQPPPEPVEASEAAGQPDMVGGDEAEAYVPRRHSRRYKIQEVIKRRQVLLVQVVKEERGTKGAALTTYLSLAGRYCVLMPNTARGGGVSRKITTATDRKRLREIIDSLEVPDGMGLIVRTAGQQRTKPDIRRDYEYLVRMWDNVRELTLQSVAPALVYEEASLIKRSIRDLYRLEVEAVFVEGEEGYKQAKSIMKMLMPSHAKRVQRYEDRIPLFHRYQVETQLEAMHSPRVQLRSGGYIVLNSTEALVAIDVNSGRATRERNIEETATRTNLEAAEEVARQLRLRDLAGLIVIDFIDMEEGRNNRAVEGKLKEALKGDRARIQVGRISAFGLLELSRQRLRPSLLETSTERCPTCGGTGLIRSTESAALHVLRVIEDEGIRGSALLTVEVPAKVAVYLLNQKRTALSDVERRFGLVVTILPDLALVPPAHRIAREARAIPVEQLPRAEAMTPIAAIAAGAVDEDDDEATADADAEVTETAAVKPATVAESRPPREHRSREHQGERREGAQSGDEERGGKRRRRGKRGGRRRRGRREDGGAPMDVRPPFDAGEPAQGGNAAPPLAPHLAIGRDLDGVSGPEDFAGDDPTENIGNVAETRGDAEHGQDQREPRQPGEPGSGRRRRRRRSRRGRGGGDGRAGVGHGGSVESSAPPAANASPEPRRESARGEPTGAPVTHRTEPPAEPVASRATPAPEPPPPAPAESAAPPSAPADEAKPRRKGWWNFGR